MSQPTGPRVFISYSHDSPEHRERVLKFAYRLRKDGVGAWIDQFDMHHADPWRTWMRQEIEKARKVLMVFTPTYMRRFQGNYLNSSESTPAVCGHRQPTTDLPVTHEKRQT